MKLDQNSYMEDNRGERFSPWCSYSDIFCSLMMIFILLFLFVMLQYVSAKAIDMAETQHILQEREMQLNDTMIALAAAEAEVERRDTEIAAAEAVQTALKETVEEKALLSEQVVQLQEEQQADALLINTYKSRADNLSEELENTRIQLGTRNDVLTAAQTKISEQEVLLMTAEENLLEKAAEVEEMALLLEEREEENQRLQGQIETLQGNLSSLEEMYEMAEGEKQVLESQQKDLQDENSELASEKKKLETDIEEIRKDLVNSQSEISELETALTDQEQKARSVQALYNAQSAALAAANAKLEDIDSTDVDEQIAGLQQQLDEKTDALQRQEDALAEVAGIRLEIISEIRDALNSDQIEARVDDETGAIIMSSELLFGVNQAELQPAGKRFLDTFFPVYFRVLTQGRASDSIAQIIVEGHTDITGDYLSNLDLSLRRAQSVVAYCVSMISEKDKQELIKMISASGCSFSNPIYKADGTVDMARSRRVEVKFTLKDQYMIEEIASIIEN